MGVLFFKGCGGGNVKSGSLQSPLRKGGEGTGVGGFDLLAVFVKSGAAIGIISLQVLPLREGNRAVRPFGSPCEQGEP